MGNQFKAGRSNFPTGLELSELVVGWCRNGLMEDVNDIYKLTPDGVVLAESAEPCSNDCCAVFSIWIASCGKEVGFDNDESDGKPYLKLEKLKPLFLMNRGFNRLLFKLLIRFPAGSRRFRYGYLLLRGSGLRYR